MSYRNFLDELKKGLSATGYVLAASDPFLHAEAALLIRGLVPEGEREFNFQTYDVATAKESGIAFEHIIDDLNTVPFFSGRKFVIVENSHKLLKKDLKINIGFGIIFAEISGDKNGESDGAAQR